MFPTAAPSPRRSRTGAWLSLGLVVASALAVARWVDLTPRVESDFFFAADDPQLVEDQAVRARYRTGQQAILRVVDPGASAADPAVDRRETVDRIEALADAFAAVDGVERVYSAATHDPDDPLYGRILAPPDPAASNIVLQLDETDPEVLVPRLEAVVTALGDGLSPVLSGAPVIIEQIRRSLFRDLLVFTGAAVLIVTLLVGFLYRDAAVLVGMLAASALAVNATLLAVRWMGVAIGLLTANLATIVFVLTLSHMVFITANARRALADGAAPDEAARQGLREALEGSFWAMATTGLGFLSLLVATARPLRELGTAGAVGALLAFASAYTVYPRILGAWGRHGNGSRLTPVGHGSDAGAVPAPTDPGRPAASSSAAALPASAAVVGVVVVGFLALGVPRVGTDPGLLDYFAADSEVHEALARIDADGGTSPLYLAVRDPDDGPLDTEEAYDRMSALQTRLESDPGVGVVLGPSVLIDQARTMPLARLLPLSVLLDIASSPRLDEVALGFVTADRDEGLYLLRMREAGRALERDSVLAQLRDAVEVEGLAPAGVAGLYDLQARLGALIRESLAVGLSGLWLLFLGVAAVVARATGTVLRMAVCLAVVPIVVLGVFGWLGISVDIITSPAASVALAVGVDAMLHL
ncbi:MAG: MMPL family transporter, partial [Gemmatimonadetes bacterium]|nr:MMPL family transporter [Gemmatimonadota bacterium]